LNFNFVVERSLKIKIKLVFNKCVSAIDNKDKPLIIFGSGSEKVKLGFRVTRAIRGRVTPIVLKQDLEEKSRLRELRLFEVSRARLSYDRRLPSTTPFNSNNNSTATHAFFSCRCNANRHIRILARRVRNFRNCQHADITA